MARFPTEAVTKANPEAIYKWQQRLQRKPHHRLIALHWQGNPEHEQSLYSRGRSMRFQEAWTTKQRSNRIRLNQKGQASEQLETDQGPPLREWPRSSEQINGFSRNISSNSEL